MYCNEIAGCGQARDAGLSCAETIARLRKEYGSSICGSGSVETSLCTLRMKDCILMIQWALASYAWRVYEEK